MSSTNSDLNAGEGGRQDRRWLTLVNTAYLSSEINTALPIATTYHIRLLTPASSCPIVKDVWSSRRLGWGEDMLSPAVL